MIHKQKTHTGKIVVIVLLGFLGLGMYGYFGARNAAAVDVADNQTDDPTGLLALVHKIQSIQLDGSLFTDTTFKSLQDYTTALPAQTVGKTNPFAPIGAPATKTSTKR